MVCCYVVAMRKAVLAQAMLLRICYVRMMLAQDMRGAALSWANVLLVASNTLSLVLIVDDVL